MAQGCSLSPILFSVLKEVEQTKLGIVVRRLEECYSQTIL